MKILLRTRCALIAGVIGVLGCQGASSEALQDVHPTKEVFVAADTWPAVSPGQFPLTNFQPFRAVYERVYQDHNGEQRDDRVVITAERVAWGPTAAILVTLVDTGNLDYDDTTPRVHTRIFAEDDQRLLFQITPAPGTPSDYLLINTEGPTVRVTGVENATGEATVQTTPAPTPQLGVPALWVVGSMSLEEGQTIRFGSADTPAASNILGARPYEVSGRETFSAGPAGEQEPWVVNYPLGMVNARVMQNLVIDRPPYLLGKRPMDLDSGETSESGTLRLIEFSVFGGS